MAVTRRSESAGTGVSYDFDNDIRMYGFASLLKSTMQCSGDPLPGLLDWTTEYEMRSINKPGSPVKLTEHGRHKDGVLEITNSSGTRQTKTGRPIAPQWAVMDALRGAKAIPSDPMAGVEFDLLHDLTSYRPHQRLAPCGVLDITLDGKPYTLHGFIQTGMGTMPTHYWIDADGRPLLATAGLLSIAMTSIQA